MAMKGYSTFPKAPALLEPHQSDCLVSYPGHSLGGGLTPLQRSSRCILQPQPTGQSSHSSFLLWLVILLKLASWHIGHCLTQCDLKVAEMNIQHSLILEFMLYKFELGYNAVEVTKNIFYEKSEGSVDGSTVNRWLKKFCYSCMNLDDQTRSGRSKTVNTKGVLRTIELNPKSVK